jgi:ferredoxin--NADP+ reductase
MRQARSKILEKARRKYLFDFQELRVPTGLLVDDGRLVGVQMSHTEVSDGRVRTLADTPEPVHSSLTVSSIGSIPEPIEGIPQHGEVYDYVDSKVGLLIDGDTAVYAAGNVLTGKGNIKDSLESGIEIGIHVAEAYLGVSEDGSDATLADSARRVAEREGEEIAASLTGRPSLPSEVVAAIMRRVHERQAAVGYEGDYRGWIAKVTPPDLQ